MAKEQVKNGNTKRIYLYIAIIVGLTTILNRGIDFVTAKAEQAHTVEDIEKNIAVLKAEGCDPSRTNSYNMVRIETQLAGLKEIVEGIKKDNDSDHRDILDAINPSSP